MGDALNIRRGEPMHERFNSIGYQKGSVNSIVFIPCFMEWGTSGFGFWLKPLILLMEVSCCSVVLDWDSTSRVLGT
jgi:hypothetical protein